MQLIDIIKNKKIVYPLIILVGVFLSVYLSLKVNLALFFGWCLLLICLVPFFIAIKKSKIDIFEPIYAFVAYVILTVVIRGFLDLKISSYYLRDLFDVRSDYFINLIAATFIIYFLGLVGFYLGYYSKLSREAANFLPKIKFTGWSRKNSLFIGIFCWFVGLLTLCFIIYHNGGLSFILNNQRAIAAGSYGQYWLFSLLNLPILGLSFMYIKTIKEKKTNLEKMFLLLNFLIILFILIVFSFKKNIVVLIIGLVTFYHYLNKRLTLSKLTILLLLVILIFSFAFLIRSYGWNISIVSSQIKNILKHPLNLFSPMISRSYLADSTVLILNQLKNGSTDFQLGKPWLELFYWFVPRNLWPDKPVTYSRFFALQFFGHTEIGQTSFVTPGLFGELYLNFSWLGVMLGGFLIGFLFKSIYLFLIKKNANKEGVFLYGTLFLSFIFILEGPLSVQLEFILTNLAMILVLIFLLNIFTKNKLEN